MRTAPVMIATAGLLLATLTGCATGASPECTAPISSGPSSELVDVSGDFGTAPTVDFPTPLKTKTTQRSEVIAGEGAPVAAGQKVKIDLSVFNGTTGKKIEASAYDGTDLAGVVLNDKTITGLADGLTCAPVGSRVAVVVTPEDAFGPGGNADLGVKGTDSLVFVLDVVKAYLPRANGAVQAPEAGLPAVVLAEDGRPGVTIPSGEAPNKVEIGVLKKGAGARVKEGDPVTVHYTGVLWDSKKVFDSSWETGTPAEFLAADGSTTQGGVVPGFAEALIGQKVGSQVVAVVPPAAGYGDQASGSIPANSTLVFVVDILGVN